VPALSESVPGYDLVGWNMLAGPAGMPPEVAARPSDALRQAIDMPDTVDKLRGWGHEPFYRTPEEMREIVVRDYQVWGDMARTAGLIE
jgi:tripartite-type tricarboxylate transporter receptor subunit TctC